MISYCLSKTLMYMNGLVEWLSMETIARGGNFHIFSLNFEWECVSFHRFEIMIMIITVVCWFRETVKIGGYLSRIHWMARNVMY